MKFKVILIQGVVQVIKNVFTELDFFLLNKWKMRKREHLDQGHSCCETTVLTTDFTILTIQTNKLVMSKSGIHLLHN